jgi:hypothetical protein
VSGADPIFVDEIDFPARQPDEKGCAPDYSVFVAGRCWIIELKTEGGSHKPRQVPDYFDRAHHYHPDLRVDVTYLTAGLRAPFHPATRSWERYVHLEWPNVADLIRDAWSDADDECVVAVMRTLLEGITNLSEPPREWWARLGSQLEPAVLLDLTPARDASAPEPTAVDDPSDALAEGLALARVTGVDGRQRAIGLEAGGLEALHELRLVLRRVLQARPTEPGVASVQPWLWSDATSGGKPMTAAGRRTGYEVRLSRSRSAA